MDGIFENKGGPACPQKLKVGDTTTTYFGLSARDYFAAQALASGDASNWRDNNYRPSDGLSVIENTARHAYLIADAMLKAREAA